MKKNICMIIVLGATLIMASCSSSTPSMSTVGSVVPQLFTLQPTQNRQMLQKTAKGYLKTLLADPAKLGRVSVEPPKDDPTAGPALPAR